MAAIILGGIVFNGFEIPEKVNFGGEHKLAVHEILGGGRVVDAMGARADDIKWRGIFQGGDAVSRARAVDILRISGSQVLAAYGSIARSVVVRKFEAEFERFYQVPYEICLCVVSGDGAGAPSIIVTLDDLLSGDLAFADQLTR
jgi:hypothetical protein